MPAFYGFKHTAIPYHFYQIYRVSPQTDYYGNTVRRLNVTSGIITTVVGSGEGLYNPNGVAVDANATFAFLVSIVYSVSCPVMLVYSCTLFIRSHLDSVLPNLNAFATG